MKIKKNTALTAGFLVMATLMAKLCGMLRDIALAGMYGTETNQAIAFSTASRIPLLFFDIALGSAVTSAFIPIFNEYLEKYAGHIGYSVHPDERRKGYASEMLANTLPYCKGLGIKRVLVTCDADNEASRRTIVKNGGVYEKTVHEPEENVDIERYWITL